MKYVQKIKTNAIFKNSSLMKYLVMLQLFTNKYLTVTAPALTVVNNRKLFFGQHGAVTKQERLIFKKYFLTTYQVCKVRPTDLVVICCLFL